MKIVSFLLFIMLVWASAWTPAWSRPDREVAGFVKIVSGKVYVIIQDETESVEAVANMKLSSGDTIRTGKDGSVGLIFRDDTVISLGPESEFMIEDFQFYPVKQELSFIGKLFHGTINFISGQITKLAPDNVHLETPDATLGVRGTQMLVEIK